MMLLKSTFVRIVGARFLASTGKETVPPIPWFAAAQKLECKQNLAGLAPKGRFISASGGRARS
jgi:hypothetical protein